MAQRLSRLPSHEPLSMAPAAIPTTAPALSPIIEEAARDPAAPPLAVRVQVHFTDPLVRDAHHPYTRDYASSDALRPTKRLCKGLVRRIEHCSEELITRRDPTALLQRLPGQGPRELRYELVFTILRPDQVFAQRTFQSYQREPLSQESASEILLATHRMIGLFLRQHDKGFKWTNEPVRDHRYINRVISSSLLGIGEPLPLGCVPPSHFLEDSQTFQFTPGYSIEFSFKSSSQLRKENEWSRTLSIKSGQDAPLNLSLSENLLWAASEVVNTALGAKKRELDFEHHSCEWLEGPVQCKHFEENALDIEIRLENSLGPVYEHLNRRILTKLAMFRDAEGEDCYYFLRDVQAGLSRLRNKADEQISQTNDFELRVLELRGPGWKVERPAQFTLDGAVTYSQRSIEAILERVQSGIADVLRGDDAAVHLTAYKRGHLILDKALIARDDGRRPKTPASPRDIEAEKKALVSRLESRIQQDLDRILKDTCSLDDLSEDDSEAESNIKAQMELLQPVEISATPAVRTPVKKGLFISTTPTATPPKRAILDFDGAAELSVLSRATTPVPQTPRSPASIQLGDPFTPVSARSLSRVFPLVPTKYTLGYSRASSDMTLTGSIDEITLPLEADDDEALQKPPAVVEAELLPELDSSTVDPAPAADIATPEPEVAQAAQQLESDSDSKPSQGEAPAPVELAENATKGTILSSDPANRVPGDDEAEPVSPQSTRPNTAEGDAPTEGLPELPVTPEPEEKQVRPESGATSLVLYDTHRPMYSSFMSYEESVPSTPGLSQGDEASPRHSLLITPTFLRTLSGASRPIIVGDMDKDEGGGAYGNSDDEAMEDSPSADRLTMSKRNLQAELAAAGSALGDDNGFSQSKASFDFEDMDGESSLAASGILPQIDEVPTEEEEEESESESDESSPIASPGPKQSAGATTEPKAPELAAREAETMAAVETKDIASLVTPIYVTPATVSDIKTSDVPAEADAKAALGVEAQETSQPATNEPARSADHKKDVDDTASVSSQDSANTPGGAEVRPVTPASEALGSPMTPRAAIRQEKNAITPPGPALAPEGGISSESWEDCDDSLQGRDSVDTHRKENGDNDVAQPPTTPPPRRKSFSAGCRLALHQESRGLEYGIRGALSRDAVADQMQFVGYIAINTGPIARPTLSTRSSSKGLRVLRPHVVQRRTTTAVNGSAGKPSPLKRLPKGARRRTKSSSATAVLEGRKQQYIQYDSSTDEDDEGYETDDGGVMLPRFMMLFASMAVASQVLQH
ncbi:hypothetical protein MAPG_06775 [Magnaporthiopsis poae ATCC 64411]|uniref:Pt repeat family protein n=1 Tax=Magnaporthiopsis poae (strain ATCC 64411 / 73-15) TaxID=644358 RepID=A0A0C4E2Y3_MAGP6|nr:hypothetical protein MAPG_06775 [Magnaporthiopsis poae ATCC 64411]